MYLTLVDLNISKETLVRYTGYIQRKGKTKKIYHETRHAKLFDSKSAIKLWGNILSEWGNTLVLPECGFSGSLHNRPTESQMYMCAKASAVTGR